jgi:uncharacterized iron-regulated membrane protein
VGGDLTVATIRTAVRSIHLALALVGGVLLSVVTLSGASVVFRGELDWLYADTTRIDTTRSIALDATARSIIHRWPDVRIQRLLTPAGTGYGDEWQLRDSKGTATPADDTNWKIFTDPATGTILGDTNGRSGSAALAWLARFHHNLFLGKIGGILVGSAGLCMLGFIVTGLWLWWPGLTRLGSGFRLHLRQGTLLRNVHLHSWIGIIGTPVLLIVALTGTMFEFRWMRSAVHYGLGGSAADRPLALRQQGRMPTAQDATPEHASKTLDFDRAIAAAEAAAPGHTLAVMPPRPGRADAPWSVLLDYPGNVGSLSGVLIQLEADGSTRLMLDPRTMRPGGWVNGQIWGLHTGSWAGGWSKAGYMVSGLLPPLLMVSGLGIWLHRRRQRRRAGIPDHLVNIGTVER